MYVVFFFCSSSLSVPYGGSGSVLDRFYLFPWFAGFTRFSLMSSSSILGCQPRVSFICASGSIFLFVLWCENPSCFASLFILALSVLCIVLSRIQLAPHARRRAVPKTVSGWIPVVRLTSNEEWTYRDNDCIYSEYALSEENPMDCIMHYLLGDNIIS